MRLNDYMPREIDTPADAASSETRTRNKLTFRLAQARSTKDLHEIATLCVTANPPPTENLAFLQTNDMLTGKTDTQGNRDLQQCVVIKKRVTTG